MEKLNILRVMNDHVLINSSKDSRGNDFSCRQSLLVLLAAVG